MTIVVRRCTGFLAFSFVFGGVETGRLDLCIFWERGVGWDFGSWTWVGLGTSACSISFVGWCINGCHGWLGSGWEEMDMERRDTKTVCIDHSYIEPFPFVLYDRPKCSFHEFGSFSIDASSFHKLLTPEVILNEAFHLAVRLAGDFL